MSKCGYKSQFLFLSEGGMTDLCPINFNHRWSPAYYHDAINVHNHSWRHHFVDDVSSLKEQIGKISEKLIYNIYQLEHNIIITSLPEKKTRTVQPTD
jgi:hypothetical protein